MLLVITGPPPVEAVVVTDLDLGPITVAVDIPTVKPTAVLGVVVLVEAMAVVVTLLLDVLFSVVVVVAMATTGLSVLLDEDSTTVSAVIAVPPPWVHFHAACPASSMTVCAAAHQ